MSRAQRENIITRLEYIKEHFPEGGPYPVHAEDLDDAIESLKALAVLMEFNEPPKINIRCQTSGDGVVGTTSLNVIRVEQEDDGSYTAVTDYWPSD